MSLTTPSLQALADATARILILVDRQGRITLASNLAQQQLGISPNSLLANTLPSVWPRADAVLNGKLKQSEIPLQVAGRDYFIGVNPLLENGQITGAVCILVDSTQLDKMTNQLPSFHTLTRELDTIIDSSSDGLFVCDADAKVIRVNPASERALQASSRA